MASKGPTDLAALARQYAGDNLALREIVQRADRANVGELFVELAHILRPSTTHELSWPPAASSILKDADFGSDTGKWCIVRPAATLHGGTHAICVYRPRSNDRADVMRVREVLREMGFTEELGYKTDHATIMGVYGTPNEWLYRA
jgi:hypothetical protein